MVKKATRLFTLFSVLFFILMAALLSYRLITIRSDNISAAERSYKVIQGELSVLHKLGISMDTETLRDRFEQLNKRRPPLRALVIYSETSGIYFIKADRRELFTPETLRNPDTVTLPAYTAGPGNFLLLRSALPFKTETAETVYVDALFEILGREDLHNPLRLCIILLAGYLIITFFILIYSGSSSRKPTVSDSMRVTDTVPPPPAAPKKKEPQKGSSPAVSKDIPPGLYSPDTNLVWEAFLQERLDNELKRAASFDQDLVLGLLSVSGYPASFSLKALGALILQHFPFTDLVFSYGLSGVAVIIPNTDLDQGIAEFEALQPDILELEQTESNLIISVGLTSRNGRLLDAQRLIKEAHRALEKALSEKKNSIIAFKTDPAKYREFIASKV
ncbi:MAG: hypothetical protein JW760_11115 [Spirochaetales bacterium]|nr:hypothetical protein [Spirochaetales bacterium]